MDSSCKQELLCLGYDQQSWSGASPVVKHFHCRRILKICSSPSKLLKLGLEIAFDELYSSMYMYNYAVATPPTLSSVVHPYWLLCFLGYIPAATDVFAGAFPFVSVDLLF